MPLLKRSFDFLSALISLILFTPLMLIIGLMILFVQGRPILYRQRRPGYKGNPFILYKFRTMNDGMDSKGQLLPDKDRITKLGRFLRMNSLDELPELINILKGEMSFVGPRPLLMEYLPLYSREQSRRHDVVPGLTGWAQIHGRNSADWQTRLAMDVWYVDHRSFWLDIRILVMTLWRVIRREGINQPGQATVEYFTGNKD